ncbi:SMP-30/gluconolactonase/LRE family protein [Lentzea sp. NPDC051213]|uniref:SMP-30/gluconolactonase/LRE family protein n=1 Tax=Lentzea sp. NPDC051213 TaxID=3364126 RepID=UPI0037AB0CF0
MSNTTRTFGALAAVVLAAASVAPAAASGRLELVAQSDGMVWNAVAVDHGRVFVGGQRWSGSTGPALGLITADGGVAPYPDAAWNAWRPGDAAGTAFVNVNAINLDGRGGLWAVDTGAPTFGGDPLPGGAKLVRVDVAGNRVSRVYPFNSEVAPPGSYVNDVRFNGHTAYLTDAGRPGLIVLDLRTGAARRVLDGHPSTAAPADRPVVVDGTVVRGADGKPLKVNADPLELSPDRRWLYYGPLSGPWSRVPTWALDDPGLSPARLAGQVRPWADLPPTGGTAMDRKGNLYFSDLARNSVARRSPGGRITEVVQDPRLHWTDAPFLDARNNLWLPVPQLDRAAPFNGGTSRIRFPVQLFRLALDC